MNAHRRRVLTHGDKEWKIVRYCEEPHRARNLAVVEEHRGGNLWHTFALPLSLWDAFAGASAELLDESEVAKLLACSMRTLQGWRSRGEGPPYIKLGDRSMSPVRYDRKMLGAWVKSQTVDSPKQGEP